MKKTTLFVFLLLLLVMPAWATSFVEIGRDDGVIISIDTDSIQKRDEYIVVWVKYILRGEDKKKIERISKAPADHIMTFYALNPDIRQSQTLQMNIYGTKGNVVFSKSDAFSRYNYKEEVPDTWGATVYNFVLRYYRADPYQQKSYSVMTPEVWKNVMEVGKLQACIDYLGIAPEDFDVYDQTHIAARDRAIKETKTLMQELMRKYGWQ